MEPGQKTGGAGGQAVQSEGRVLVIGLDGATWDLLRPWAEEGYLPNLQALMKAGAWGILRSTIPPSTPPAWTSFATGKNPGKHGIFDFHQFQVAGAPLTLINSYSIRAPTLWHILSRQGRRVGCINIPVTYPAQLVNGFLISGMMTPGLEADWIYPPELGRRLLDAIGEYVIDIEAQSYHIETQEDALRFLAEVLHAFRQRRDALYFLLDHEPWDLLIAVFILPDRIQHKLWKYLDPGCTHYAQPEGQVIREAALRCYREMDEMLGVLGARLRGKDYLCLMSDHGFGPLDGYFDLNAWLARHGVLCFKPLGVSRLKGWLRPLIPEGVLRYWRWHKARHRSLFNPQPRRRIDWTRTWAYFSSPLEQGVRLCTQTGGETRSEMLAHLLKVMGALRHPTDGQPLIDQVYQREEIYHGPWTGLAADLLISARNYRYLGISGSAAGGPIIHQAEDAQGFHRPDGLFLVHGPGIRAGSVTDGAHITDVAPTILYLLQEQIPDDMDGQVMRNCFDPAHLETFPPCYRRAEPYDFRQESSFAYSDEDAAEITSRLEGLGYLDPG